MIHRRASNDNILSKPYKASSYQILMCGFFLEQNSFLLIPIVNGYFHNQFRVEMNFFYLMGGNSPLYIYIKLQTDKMDGVYHYWLGCNVLVYMSHCLYIYHAFICIIEMLLKVIIYFFWKIICALLILVALVWRKQYSITLEHRKKL